MMHCVFDGSFNGLLSLVFDTYRISPQVAVVTEEAGPPSLLPMRFFYTDDKKAARIKRYMAGELGEEFAFMVKAAFLSIREERFLATVKTIHRACKLGPDVLNLLEEDVLSFIACQREVRGEAHRFQGLLRFREMEDGSLLAVFAPRHHVLPLIMPHFADRFPSEELIVYDENRHIAGLSEGGSLSFARVEALSPRESFTEQAFQGLWRTFFKHLAITQRMNPALQQQHMPKYTWKNLPEMAEVLDAPDGLESGRRTGYDGISNLGRVIR